MLEILKWKNTFILQFANIKMHNTRVVQNCFFVCLFLQDNNFMSQEKKLLPTETRKICSNLLDKDTDTKTKN